MKKDILITTNNQTSKTLRWSVKSAVFNVDIETEGWDENLKTWTYGNPFLRVRYSLEIDVDESSGEDGTPQPVINNIPIYNFFDQKNPDLKQLTGKIIEIADEDWDWDAWLGNDAPYLIKNRITFLKWDNNMLHFVWTAQCQEEDEDIEYIGAAEFKGIKLKVKKNGDDNAFIKELFKNNIDLKEWIRNEKGIINYGDSIPEDRRKWINLEYLSKEPLST